MIRLVLPYPPSIWDIYTGWGRTRHHSKEYAKWRTDAGYFIKQNLAGIINGPFSISIALKRPNNRQDIDNRIKAILDTLEHYKIIKNDRYCERLTVQWDPGLTEGCVVIIQDAEEGLAA